jgi:hypothetical protein
MNSPDLPLSPFPSGVTWPAPAPVLLVTFAEYALGNMARLWLEASPEQKRGMQALLLPERRDLRGRPVWNHRSLLDLQALAAAFRPKFR